MRTALGAAWLSVYTVALFGAANDLIATHFHVSVNAVTWTVRIGLFAGPLAVFVVVKRWDLALQLRDRDKIRHGRETGVIKRLPHGEFVDVHERLSQERLLVLTAHKQYKPLAVARGKASTARPPRGRRLRAGLSRAFYGQGTQIPKPTAEEYKAVTSRHQR
ncbi:hypothetical protein ACIOZL_17420 [Streptomyces sp. NPDC087769]|uniref:hypothetical protein n=1 Tax=Streptomyces sp. NPDC087769 TaxID=3365802 RepID=UPI0038128D6B